MCVGGVTGEDGYHGRGIIHPAVTTVPFAMMLRWRRYAPGHDDAAHP